MLVVCSFLVLLQIFHLGPIYILYPSPKDMCLDWSKSNLQKVFFLLCFGLKASGNHLALAIVHEISDISFSQNHLDFEMQKLPYIYNEYHLEKALLLQFVLVPVFLLDALELDHVFSNNSYN